MVELVISGLAVLSFGGYIYKATRLHNKKFVDVSNIWENNLKTFMDNNGISDVDFKFADGATRKTFDLKKKSNVSKINVVGIEINKGYDLIDCTFEDEYSMGPHSHSGSSEFFYVIEGEAKVVIEPDGIERKLVSGDYVYLEKNVAHEFFAEKDSRCIVVTLPNIVKAGQ